MQNKQAVNEVVLRTILIVGACLCFVIGATWVAEHIVYHVEYGLPFAFINLFAFVPLVALAPHYKQVKYVYAIVAVIEAFIILMGNFLTLR